MTETGSLSRHLDYSKNWPRLEIFLLLCDKKMYPVHKRTKSVPEIVFIISLNFKGYFYHCLSSFLSYLNICIRYRSGPEILGVYEIPNPLVANLWLTYASPRWTGAVWRSGPVHLSEPFQTHIIQISIYGGVQAK